MKTFKELREIPVAENLEKKGNLSYLSWAWAVDYLMQNDPAATWSFHEPKFYGSTCMVSCEVTAFGKTLSMFLPVMDNRHGAVVNPTSRQISDATMRCLTKCIACFGIGLSVYAGEDLPEVDSTHAVAHPNAPISQPRAKEHNPPLTQEEMEPNGKPHCPECGKEMWLRKDGTKWFCPNYKSSEACSRSSVPA